MIIAVPRDATFYPTLGRQVCEFIEQNMVFGPGDLRGEPIVLDDERRGLIYRMYEVYPRGHRLAGRRRFKRVGLSLPKGLGKTELAALVAACELHPEAPVRCTGWTRGGEPIGGPVTDPYIPLIAYTEEQSSDTAFAALRVICESGAMKDDLVVGIEKIERKKGGGKAVSLSGNPNARDGARTTFIVFDETHRWTLLRLRMGAQVMLNNLAKRPRAQPWAMEITTAPEPGTGSVAEATMDYALAVESGKIADSSLFFFHRQSSDHHDLNTLEGARAAVVEASGAAAAWRDIDHILSIWQDPTQDRAYWERVWCNRLVQGSTQAFDVERWKKLAEPQDVVPGALIVIGFDGSQFHDATAIVATDVATGYQWTAGAWECPPGQAEWQVPVEAVDVVVRDLFERFTVWRMYADPPYWQSWVSAWQGSFGKERVIEWWTNRRKPMATALENFNTGIRDGRLSHAGDPDMARHIANARREDLRGWRDEQGRPLWLIRKARPDSPQKIDIAMAAVLSWEARTDAIAAGALTATATPKFTMVFVGGTR